MCREKSSENEFKNLFCEDEYAMSSFSTLIPALTGEEEQYEDFISCQRK
jgi:hypothetical protein